MEMEQNSLRHTGLLWGVLKNILDARIVYFSLYLNALSFIYD